MVRRCAKIAPNHHTNFCLDEPKPMSLEKLVTEETLKRIGEWIKRNGSDQDEIDDSEPQSPRSIVHALNGTAVNANEETLAVCVV